MKILNLRSILLAWIGIAVLLLAGCHSSQPDPVTEKRDADAAAVVDESERVAEASLGKHAEVLSRGDLNRNGMDEVLVVNRFSKASEGAQSGESAPILITRAAILEKRNGNWTELLRCDERLKNPNGYLGGAPADRVSGWRLQISTDSKYGVELRFTPTDVSAGTEYRPVVVRWNAAAKRYQSLDPSHERYLSEAPSLETPQSILR